MKDLHVETRRTASPIETSRLFSMLLIVLYTYYYLHMTILHVILTSPAWMHRWVNHNSMRIMMIAMDIMLIWMCVEFGLSTVNQFGW